MSAFIATSHAVRIHAGPRALDALPIELGRAGVRQPLLLCGPTIARDSDSGLLQVLRSIGGSESLEVDSTLGKEASISVVARVAERARAQGCDGLIALGAGSVIRAARVVAILMAEDRPLESLVTRYPESGPAVSAKLNAPKVPIFNIPTVATTAQNRAGSAIPQDDADRLERLEFFDPKTRPRAIFWDDRALASAPQSLVVSTGTAVWWRALMSIAVVSAVNPLAQADRSHAWTLAERALGQLQRGQDDAACRLDLCAAALLQNRDEDDGGRPMQAHRVARLVYALGAAVFSLDRSVSQAAAYAALTGAAVRVASRANVFDDPDIRAIEAETQFGMAQALGLTRDAPSGQLADEIDRRFAALRLPTRLRDLMADRADLRRVAQFATRSFNADAEREFARRPELLTAVLEAAW